MDLLQGYTSDDDNDATAATPMLNVGHLQPKMVTAPTHAAPHVYGALPKHSQQGQLAIFDPKKAMEGLKHNPTKAELMAPAAGPAHPYHAPSFMPHLGSAAHANGAIEPTHVAPWAFEEQFHTYNSFGYAVGTSGEVVGDARKFNTSGGDTVNSALPSKRPRSPLGGVTATAATTTMAADSQAGDGSSSSSSNSTVVTTVEAAVAAPAAGAGAGAGGGGGGGGKKKKNSEGASLRAARLEAARAFELGGDPDQELGPWSEYKSEEDQLLATIEAEHDAARAAKAAAKQEREDEFDVNADLDRRDERKFSHLLPARHTKDTSAGEATSQFYGKKGTEVDYQGRPWCAPPLGLRPLSAEGDSVHDCYLPKKLVHRYQGHDKGVQALRWFPDTGHLLMTASYDGKVKIWDAHNQRACKRSYSGHTAGIRDANFTHDGRHFLTASFDRFMRYWDTETGQCISTLTNRKVPYQARFHPTEHSSFIAACSDNRLWQWDLKSGETVQEYNHHIKAVNSVLFTDDGKRFVSTSDDKKILIWEYGLPVPMKYISDPTMHAVPTTGLHPSEEHWAANSMDNEIHVYGARDRFRRLRKKVFKGHTSAGFACQMTFSPNGRYMASGDGEGRLFVWDWKSTKQLRRFRCHDDGPLIDCQWHPLEPSWVATAGWDGAVKLWD